MNIHLINDEKFIDGFINDWEKYHQDNIYVIVSNVNHTNKIKNHKAKLIFLKPNNKSLDEFVSSLNKCDNLFIHCLSGKKQKLFEKIKLRLNPKSYWIFYGAEMYSFLQYKGINEVLDYKNFSFKKTISRLKILLYPIYSLFRFGKLEKFKDVKYYSNLVDVFCFWNDKDYELAKRYLNPKLKFNFFVYLVIDLSHVESYYNSFDNNLKVLVNNSASKYGNHLTILKKMNSVTKKNVEVLLPLSYDDKSHKKHILSKINSYTNLKFDLITSYMDLNSYYKKISACRIAIFGAKRQHAAGNIFFMICIGAKVFLRNENSVKIFLENIGCYVYDYDKISSLSDFYELSEEEKNNNKNKLLTEIQSWEQRAYKNFFNT